MSCYRRAMLSIGCISVSIVFDRSLHISTLHPMMGNNDETHPLYAQNAISLPYEYCWNFIEWWHDCINESNAVVDIFAPSVNWCQCAILDDSRTYRWLYLMNWCWRQVLGHHYQLNRCISKHQVQIWIECSYLFYSNRSRYDMNKMILHSHYMIRMHIIEKIISLINIPTV